MALDATKQLCRDRFTAFLAGDREWMDSHIDMKLHEFPPSGPGKDCVDFVAEHEKVLVRGTR